MMMRDSQAAAAPVPGKLNTSRNFGRGPFCCQDRKKCSPLAWCTISQETGLKDFARNFSGNGYNPSNGFDARGIMLAACRTRSMAFRPSVVQKTV
jgi:hypothetical protein